MRSQTARRKTYRFSAAAGIAALLWFAGAAHAQTTQVPIPEEPSTQPQLEIDGTGIVTLQSGRAQRNTSGHTSSNGVDFSDSSLTFGAAQRLYRGGAVGSMALGFLTPESGPADVSGKTDLFVHQAFADFQSRAVEAYLGRTNQPSAQIVQFPTLREEDLITFTHLLNPFSSGQNGEEHRYGNIGSVVFNQKLTTFENVYVQHLLNTAEGGGSGINAVGVTFQRLSPTGLEAVQRIVNYGAGYERRSVPGRLGGPSNAVFGGGVLNLRRSLVHRIDLRFLATATFGNDTEALATPGDAFRADSRSIAASVRYLKSPFGMPGAQLALTAGYRSYPKISGAHSYGVALTGVKRLGQGFDFVAQYSYERRNGQQATAFGGRSEQALQVGFVMNFNATINQHIGPRRTLLNLRHRYIPQ